MEYIHRKNIYKEACRVMTKVWVNYVWWSRIEQYKAPPHLYLSYANVQMKKEEEN